MVVMLDWSLPLAIATFSLAGAAFWAIWQTRGIQKSEKRQRLLSEIIEWAIDITKCGSSLGIPITPIENVRHLKRVSLANLLLQYQLVNLRSKYVREIALVFGEDLADSVTIVANKLSKVVDVIYARIKDLDDKDIEEELSKSETSILEDAKSVMVKATQIKTKGIG